MDVGTSCTLDNWKESAVNVLLMTCRANSPEEDGELPDHMPLGLGYIAAYLESNSPHRAIILDTPHEDVSFEEIAELIEFHHISVLGLSTVISNYRFLDQFTRYIKNRFPGLLVVAGGPLATTLPEVVSNDFSVDVVVKGAGELVFLQLINERHNYLGQAAVVSGDLPKNIDVIPTPNWNRLKADSYNYLPPWSDFPILSSRGCPYACNYCTKISGQIYYKRSIDLIVDEIALAVEQFKLESFMIQDELLFASIKRVKTFCTALIDRQLGASWSAASRIDILDEESIVLLKQAGCRAIGVGIESGSQVMLGLMNKNLSLEKSRENLALLNRYGIKVMPYVIVGYPGETAETLKETEDFLIENRIYSAMTYAFPFPGTVLWDIAVERSMVGEVRDFLLRDEFSVSQMHFNFTGFTDEELVARVEAMKARVLRSYMKNLIESDLEAAMLTAAECKIHIFGAGYLGKGLFDMLHEQSAWGSRIGSFIDEDPRRIGTSYKGVEVAALGASTISGEDIYLIANNYYADVMHNKLIEKNSAVQTISLA